ncbi:hypothetical protein SRS16CHR_02157 [Variovorax sp. SRS16]|uniref:hypothetical protein n=1 Tax=Variovorax sp. SRS16 TaxID=282217 RepID=UPI0013190850|nr:hypothetical protein [Variovorax sp. SRS16]VTU18067.1 hypothetical protein SRS16CHR_02157 [Variovorax sp. SRS16]
MNQVLVISYSNTGTCRRLAQLLCGQQDWLWAYRLAGPMRSVVTSRRDQLPRVAVVSAMGGQGAPRTRSPKSVRCWVALPC